MFISTFENKLINIEQHERIVLEHNAQGQPAIVARSRTAMAILAVCKTERDAQMLMSTLHINIAGETKFLDWRAFDGSAK